MVVKGSGYFKMWSLKQVWLYLWITGMDKSDSSNLEIVYPNLCRKSAEVSYIQIHALVKMMLISFLHRMKYCFPFYKICNRISLFRQTWITDVLVDTSIKIKVSTETNIIGLKKGLDFAPIQSKINELE